ncbi:T9SS type A sorting domain-containing protein [Maribellus comscasis]|uniref:T9SS type A sorting domain-containing protein n=1 Tax=Maribellus comscasis TaxID=2681766 RepID=A0A6I6K1W5_9BACT|nr:cadherin-like domain-containing protein [Maribellus comscasis]QGY47458.1 T9SS type A sorting domain-containing protein [Maribellus comscasis]
MKTFLALLLSLMLMLRYSSSAQEINLPFFDDFSNDYENWTTHSLTGDDQWHLSGDDGIDGGKCARFYIMTNPPQENNDWLVSNVINTENVSNIAIQFKFLFHGEGIKPEFYYSTSFNGDVSATDWIELDNNFWKNEWSWNDARIEIESPGNSLIFAIRYQSTIENSNYILIDNFRIKAFEPVVVEKAGETNHFEFYSDTPENTDYWIAIKDELEEQYEKYASYWNIPGLNDFITQNTKSKIYLFSRENIKFINEDTPDWKMGFFDYKSESIYLDNSIMQTSSADNNQYYDGLKGLAIHTYAGYAIQLRLDRDGSGNSLPDYFAEGFGLYERGYRPNRDSVIAFKENHPDLLSSNELSAFKSITNTSEKDISVAYIEYQILLCGGYRNCNKWDYGPLPDTWKNFLIYFYTTGDDDVQIKKYDESENFDIYCSARDTMFIDSMKTWLERTRTFYIDSFQMDINVRFPLVIVYDEKTGMDLTGYGDFNGGSGGINISPHNFWGGFDDGYDWLLGHEFGHVFNDLMYCAMPMGFYHEGMANFSGYNVAGGEHFDDRWKIEYVFDYYQNNYNREPTLEEIITNPDVGKPGLEYGIDCYFFGFEFIRYLKREEGFPKIKEFFANGLDFTVFAKSYDDLEQGYIDYLKYLHSQRDYNEPLLTVNGGISIERGGSSVIHASNLDATDQEVSDDKLYFKITTKPTYGHLENIKNPGFSISKFTEKDIKNGVIKYINDSTYATSDYFIFTLTDETWFVDNKRFNITLSTPTAINEFQSDLQNTFSIYPNPVSREFVISFQTKTSGKVNLAIFDVQGKKIATLLNKKLNSGIHSVSVSNSLPAGSVYFCKLVTAEGVLTEKIIVNTK